jgi:vacuolar-type H+-ATPase subunit H
VSEAEAVAKKREETILEAANKKAMQIEDAANTQADQMKASISSEFEKTVKDATKIVVGRLVETSPNIKKDYLDSLVKEFVAAK